jgi:hypothetical protein|tara:strand:- start:955 stop:1185 length:231 start_codon:yes stop_codon:yes gene_type:complete
VSTKPQAKLIGRVSTDSGELYVLDPSHLEASTTGAVKFPAFNLFTSFETEVGDGEFEIYELRDRTGKLKRIVITIE